MLTQQEREFESSYSAKDIDLLDKSLPTEGTAGPY